MKNQISCPKCSSTSIKKNGHTHYGKQNHMCKDCKTQFVEGGQEWFVSSRDKKLIDNLLLERISLAGICRVIGVSEAWLQEYVKLKYAQAPDDLNARQ